MSITATERNDFITMLDSCLEAIETDDRVWHADALKDYLNLVERAISGYHASRMKKVFGERSNRYLAGMLVGVAQRCGFIEADTENPLKGLYGTLSGWVSHKELTLSDEQRDTLHTFTSTLSRTLSLHSEMASINLTSIEL